MLPRLPLVLLLFVVYVCGERLVQGFYQNAHAKTLAVLDVANRMNGLLQTAPTQVQDRARGQALDAILGPRSGFMTAVGIAFSGLGFLLVALETWLVSLVAAQFFGGQEERTDGRRSSWLLFLVAFVPLALRKLAAGVVMSLRDPAAASNALTLTDYQALSTVRFDLVSLLPFGRAHTFLGFAGRLLSDPFVLWTFAILCLGGREVFRIRTRGALGLCAVLLVVLALQARLFSAVGLSWEL